MPCDEFESDPPAIDMKSIGFDPSQEIPLEPINSSRLPPDVKVELTVLHEDGSMLRELFIEKVGRTQDQISADIKKAEAQGLYQNSEDWQRIRMLKRRSKPTAYICRYKGPLKELSDYIDGVIVYDGQLIKTISESHPRTWIVGRNDALGNLEIEQSYDKVLKLHKDSGRFSEIVETSWDSSKSNGDKPGRFPFSFQFGLDLAFTSTD
jgi:hypothetical protein